MFTFNKKYFILTILLFIIEVLIALYVHDTFVRPYVGDVLVVMLIYCFLKSFIKISVINAALIVLAFSFLIETLQYFNIVKILGLEHSKIAKTVIGTSFAWIDLAAYIIGFVLVLVIEKIFGRKKMSE